MGVECQTLKHPVADSALQTIQKPKSMNVNPSSIARHRITSRLEYSNNLRRAPRKMMGFCTPNVGPLSTVQYVNYNAATTSMVTARQLLVQFQKSPSAIPLRAQAPAAAPSVWPADRVGVRLAPNGTYNDMGSPDYREQFTFVAQRSSPTGANGYTDFPASAESPTRS
jgi:hypothetical protein